MVDQDQIDSSQLADVAPQQLFVDGRDGRGPVGRLMSFHPLIGSLLTTLVAASATDVENAVCAARRAFDEGQYKSLNARGNYINQKTAWIQL